MAVNATQRGPWRALLKRGLDTAADLSDLVARKISAAADPRATAAAPPSPGAAVGPDIQRRAACSGRW